MSRFISVHNMVINVDHIVRVLEQGENSLIIHNTNDVIMPRNVQIEVAMGLNLFASTHVRCNDNLWARMEQDGKEFDIAVEHLVLTADGSYYPLEAALLEDESKGDVVYKAMIADDGDDDEEYLRMNSEEEIM